MDSRTLGQPEIFKSKFGYSFIFYFAVTVAIILPSGSSITSASSEISRRSVDTTLENHTSLKINPTSTRSVPTSETERLGKQLSFFEWFFGSPASKNSTHGNENYPSHNNHTGHRTKTSNYSEPNKNEQGIVAYQNPSNNSAVYYPNINGSDSDPSGPIFAKPRNASNNRFNNSRQIEITDIQASVGTELNESNLNSDPSQVNLQEELDAIERLEKKSADGSAAGLRTKRQSQNKFRQINIPYGSGNNRINGFSKRQLFMTPEQQMLLLRQQQEIAAATMLQQQLLQNNRYNNRYVDDYYDDDSSYEDSDEPYEDFNRFGMHNPVAAAMNRGALFVPPGHPMGLGRRSIPDQRSDTIKNQNSKQLKKLRTRKASGPNIGSISKGGRWETIEDYDISSDFNRLQARKGDAEGSSFLLGDDHKELDESDEDDKATKKTSFRNRGRIEMVRQDVTTQTPSSESPVSSEETSTTPSSTTEPATSATTEESSPESQASENSATTEASTENSSDSSSGLEATTTTETATEPPMTSEIDESSTEGSSETSTTKKPKPSTTKKPKPSTTSKPMLPPFQQTLNCRCGVQSVRGEMADDGTVIRTMVNPWLVSVSTKQKHLCSGSIINNKYVLTSKQCVKGMKGLIVTAGMGSTRSARNFTVIKLNAHNSRNIALLKIKPPITPNHAMRPICLPITQNNNDRSSHATGTLVTFKKSSSRINSPIELVQTEVPILGLSKCASPAGDLPAGMICPGPPASLKCGGDTGGLLQVYQRGYSYEQIGVVANTVGCRANKAPGVYTDIRKSVKWIMYNTKDARYCRKPKVSPEALMNTKRSEADNEPEFVAEEEESEEEFTFDNGAHEEEDDEESWE